MEIKKYYTNTVLFEVVKLLVGRETVLLDVKNKIYPPVRCIKSHKLCYLNSNLRNFHFWDRTYNIYASLSRLNNMPMFSYNPKERKRQMIEFNHTFKKYFVGYDLAHDFDSKQHTFNQAYNDCKKVKELYDNYKIPYYLTFSGSGFHIVVPSQYLVDLPVWDGEIKHIVQFCEMVNTELSELFYLPTLDLGLMDVRRIWKVPYTYDWKSGNICLPLDDWQFNNFRFSMVKPENVHACGVRNRGLLVRHIDNNSNGIIKLYNDFIKPVIEVEING